MVKPTLNIFEIYAKTRQAHVKIAMARHIVYDFLLLRTCNLLRKMRFKAAVLLIIINHN